jgi:Raf kinase inhibitor-like YbhB/YbcL family protein
MADETEGTVGIALSSPEFSHQADIPAKFTCEGENINPQLTIDRIPNAAKSLTLIMDDPDAAQEPAGIGKTFDHWVVFNIPADTTVINEGTAPPGAVQGSNSSGKLGYTGPCPPTFKHKYFFKLYALDNELELEEGASKVQVEKAMAGHILGQTELIGLYEKQSH